MTQDIQLFHASVRDNLTFFDLTIADERIIATLEELGLGAEDRNQPGPKGAVKTVAPPKTPVDPNFESDSGTPEPASGNKAAPKPTRSTKKSPK